MKESWITALPEDWSLKQIRHIFKIHNGATPKSGESEYWNGDINWITPEDLGNNIGKDIVESRRKITAEGYANSGVSLAPAGSIAISTRAPIGHLAKTTIPSCVNQGCRLLEPKEGNPDYWYYAIIAVKPILVNRGQGTTFMELPRQSLASVKLPVPSIHVQQAIVRFLDFKTAQIDALIAKKQTLLDKLAEKRTALISHVVTKGLDPSVPTRDSGVACLGSIPDSWKILPFRRLIIGGTQNGLYKAKEFFSKDGTAFVQMAEAFSEPVIKRTAKDRVLLSKTELAQWGLEQDDLIFARRSLVFEGSGKCAVVGALEEPHAYESSMIRVRLNKKELNPIFALHYFGSAFGRAQMLATTKQVTISGIDSQQLKDILVCIPPIREQEEILGYIQWAESRYTKAYNKITAVVTRLQEYRAALISNAVTGKIDVRGFRVPTQTPLKDVAYG
ncbi:MAG TPA: restriction endonuclease subunit S [Methylophilaceae bacterium]|nr:restriction endonuclease subunit S [Methylophilaceae bacterium]